MVSYHNQLSFRGSVYFSGLGKKLDKLEKHKGYEKVRKWRKSIINHLYWTAASTPSGDGAVMKAKWSSLANHLCNIHR